MFSKIKENYEFYKKRYFRGDDIYCPLCSGFYKAQMYRFTKQTNMNCPICGSTIEERTVLLFLLAKTEMLSGDPRILIVAEEGVLTRFFENFPNAEVRKYSTRGDFIIRDQRGMDFDAGSFDIIVCNYILEKHPSPQVMLKDITKLLKPEGIAILQANIDQMKEKTAEYSHMYFKDRILLYGIAGNMRRYGKDYGDILKSFGLNMSRLRFSEGFDELPPLSFKKDEVFYIAHKADQPVLFDNIDDLEAEMSIQRSNLVEKSLASLIYTVFFIIPELFQNSMLSLWSNINENEHNKGKFIYMVYVLVFGTVTFWSSFAFIKLLQHCTFPGAFLVWFLIGLPTFVIVGGLGFMVMGGYFMTNDKAGIIKKAIVGIWVSITLLMSVVMSF
jgi:SAM-dependent methyltransferase